jgi:hypothetical protein
MSNTADEQLENAISIYVDSFSYKGLIRLVSEWVLDYYTNSADEEEKQMFIEEMEQTNE